jgi:cell division protein FtsB
MNLERVRVLLLLSCSFATVGCWGRERESIIANLRAREAALKAENAALRLEIQDLKDKLADRGKSKP